MTKITELLVSRGWPLLGAEAAADQVGAFYYDGTTPWTILRLEPSQPGTVATYQVSRRATDRAVYDSRLESRATDIAEVLNEIEER